MKNAFIAVNTIALIAVFVLFANFARATNDFSDKPFTVEYYNRIKWGYYDEWLTRYKMEHWPIMVAEMKGGYVAAIKVHQPQNYWPEPNRWDLRVTIAYKNVLIPHGLSDHNREALITRLYPYRGLLDREERRQSGLLEGFLDNSFVSVASIEGMPTFNQVRAPQTP
jgi:hypothetical protein